MRKALVIAAALSAMPAVAQPAAQPASARCGALAADYRAASMDLAAIDAEGLGDDSAHRATMREARAGNVIAAAAITLSLIRDNRCPAPASAPSGAPYRQAALECHRAMLRNTIRPEPAFAECDRARWQAAQ